MSHILKNCFFFKYLLCVTIYFISDYFWKIVGIVFTHGVRMGGWVGSGKKFVRAVSQKP